MSIRSLLALERFAAWANAGGWDAYIGANPTRRPVRFRAKAHDICRLRTIVLDVDPVRENADPTLAACELEIPVTDRYYSIVDSGRGIQFWVHVDADPSFAGATAQWVRMLARQWGDRLGCIVDTTCTDLPRVIRLPGTVNQKTGREARINVAEARLPTEWVEHLPYTPPESNAPPAELTLTKGWLLAYLPVRCAEFVLHGTDVERHKVVFATLTSLHEVGVPAEKALTLALHGASLSELEEEHVHRTWRQIYG